VPRYFFHVRDGKDLPDTEGSELPDLNAVRLEALRASGEMLRDNKGEAAFWSGEDWTMNVAGRRGRAGAHARFSGELYG
jgi:hypothetical protein